MGLWEETKAAPNEPDYATTLAGDGARAARPGHHRPPRPSDYYVSHYGFLDLSNSTRASDSLTDGNAGSPGQPNLQFAGAELIPGQTLANGFSLYPYLASGTTATTAAGSPAAAIHVAAVTTSGGIVTNILNGSTWSGWQYVGGPSVVKPVFVDNPKTASRSLYAVDAFTGQLYLNRYIAVGSNPAAFQGWQATGATVSGVPVAAVNATTGDEAVVYNDATGVTNVITNTAGTLSKPSPLPGNAKLVDYSIASTPSGFVVLGFNGTQLSRTVMASDRTFSAVGNVGSAISSRAVGIPAVARFNATAGQLEVLAAGQNGALQLLHVKLGSGGAADTITGPVNVGISTDATPALAINTDNGDLMVLARGATLPIPSGERLNPTAGMARTAILRNAGTSFLAPVRIARGLMPPGVPPAVFYNANTKTYQQLLVGDDYQLYRNTAAP